MQETVENKQTSNSSGSEDNMGTTTFLADIETKTVEVSQPRSISNMLISGAHLGSEMTIKDFFAKPIRLSNGAFAVTDTGNSIIAANIINKVATSSQFNVWTNKIKGYYAMRFTMVFKLVVNATRFQQGRYILAFVPTGGVGNNSSSNDWYLKHSCFIRQVVQLPHVEIDLATETEVTLKIPFICNQIAFPTTPFFTKNGLYDMGTLFTRPYSALIAPAGSNVADWTLYMSLEDVELFGAATQSGRGKISSKKKFVSNYEQEQAGIGPVEKGMRGISLVSDSLSSVPVLSQFTQRVKWASDFVGGVCSKFGWCKPADLSCTQKVRRVIFPNISNVDGADASAVLALSEENIVGVCDGFAGTDLDELAFSHLFGVQNYCGSFTFSTAKISGDELWSQNLSPYDSNLIESATDHGKTILAMGTLPFTASFFQQYRGSLCMRVKLVKTEFHSGRICIAYYPQLGIDQGSMSYDDSAYVYRTIVDIRESNEIEIIAPYVSTFPYRTINDPYGIIKIFCVDPLVAPNTVSTSITGIVELLGTKDLELSIPALNNFTVITPTTTQSGKGRLINDGGVSDDKRNTVFLGESSMDEIQAAESCVGEKIISFRSLLKRPNVNASYSVTGTPANQVSPVNYNPYLLRSAVYIPSTTSWWVPAGEGTNSSDTLDVLGQCFALMRGGIRTKIACIEPNQGLITGQLYATGTTVGWVPGWQGASTIPKVVYYDNPINYDIALNANQLLSLSRPDLTGGVEVSSPQYSSTHSRVSAMMVNPAVPGSYLNDTRYGAPNYLLRFNFGADSHGYVIRSGSDDFSLGGFISVPTFNS